MNKPKFHQMESSEIVSLILKYFDFQQLCIAERINRHFKHFVQLELSLLKYVDFNRISANPKLLPNIHRKICSYCKSVRSLNESTGFIYNIKSWSRVRNILTCLRGLKKLRFDFGNREGDLVRFNDLLSNARNLSEIVIAGCPFDREFSSGLVDQFNETLSAHTGLTSLEIEAYHLWIDCSKFSNLKVLRVHCPNFMDFREEYEKFHTLIANNPNLEIIDFSPIAADSTFIATLMTLKKLTKLTLRVQTYSAFAKQAFYIKDELFFENLQDLLIESDWKVVNQLALVIILSKRAPCLKRCWLMSKGRIKQSTYMKVLNSIRRPEQIECFFIDNIRYDFDFENREFQFTLPIYDKIVQMMTNVRHIQFNCFVPGEDSPKIGTLKNLAYLEIFEEMFHRGLDERECVESLKFLCTSSLVALKISLPSYSTSPAMLDAIYENCPNLLHLSMLEAVFPQKQMRRLAAVYPKLKFLEVRLAYYGDELDLDLRYERAKVEDLMAALENLPDLKILSSRPIEYETFVHIDWIKKRCRQGKLMVINVGQDGHTFCPKICCNEKPCGNFWLNCDRLLED